MKKQIAIIVVSVVGLLIVTGLVVYFTGANWTERGTIGDSFGMTNALFSGLAFAGVVYAILLQREELALQREELRLTRDELSKSAVAQGQSADTQRQLAQLNAYSSLMTYKLAEMRECLENASSGRPEIANQWVARYKEVKKECVRIEAYIENILFRVGGRLDNGASESFEESVAKLKAMSEMFSRDATAESNSESEQAVPPNGP